jgi:hypothetical protein
LENKGIKRLFGWLLGAEAGPSPRRKAERHAIPGLVAYFPLGHSPVANDVRSISTEGFYVVTEERWAPGTSLVVSLQIVNPQSHQIEAMISIPSKVVSFGVDGVGFAFDDEPAHQNPRIDVTNVEELVQLKKFLERIKQ